ncbi:MAG: hypothetical protein GY711_34410 [bacterium]|nr:hypothetical protein [bacterium]
MSPLTERLLAALCCALISTCGNDEPSAPGTPPTPEVEAVQPDWETATSRAGRYRVAWRPAGGPIPLNEPFELDVEVRTAADDAPVTGGIVSVIAEMPEHGHGMLREPRATEQEGGRYRVKGMLMHMTGRWVLSIDVIVNSVSESTDFEVVLE